MLLINLGTDNFSVTRSTRIAQIVIAPVTRASVEGRSHAAETQRGAGGFGSTGTA